ncbi:MAG: S-layer homology domain-containing protein, partial [Oscillospiraceae bacterium]|jgi:hypothetical protein|nr:S-layer homology domain-containing protein [Oscillospiraceae bacterium]
MVTMLHNYLTFKGYDIPLNQEVTYEDSGEVSPWAAEAVTSLGNAGVLNGFAEGMLYPVQSANRAELAQIFMDFLRLVAGA